MDKFYIIANSEKEECAALRSEIADYLKNRGKECGYQDDHTAAKNAGYRFTHPDLMPEDVEGVIVLGGDGTVIQAARDLARRDVAFLGVNMGTLGYLTEVESKEYREALDSVMNGEYHLEERMMLAGLVTGEDGEKYRSKALNDIVISRSGVLRIINFQIFVNGRYLKSYNADGMIISTPTGSTGYNLSAGGPILKPNTEVLVITPICTHTLNNRSIVVSSDDVITVEIDKNLKSDVLLIMDGKVQSTLKRSDRVEIKKAPYCTSIIKTNDYGFYEILRKKIEGKES